MADEQYRWLDRDTAERLLRGEPLDTVDASARERAERLARALNALSVVPDVTEPELPGEAAAMAAFRKARAEAADAVVSRAPSAPARTRDAGLVRIGAHAAGRGRRVRWGRPVRLAVSAALAAGAVGGVAAAATGVLPTPFGGNEPHQGTTVSTATTPDASVEPPASQGTAGGRSPLPVPGVTGSGASGTAAPDTSRGSGAPSPGASSGSAADETPGAGPARGWKGLVSACRDLREGRGLGADRKRALDGAAGGSARVWTYCKGVLKAAGTGTQGSGGAGDSRGADGGSGGQDGQGDQGGKGGEDDGGHHYQRSRRSGLSMPSASALVPSGALSTPVPGPSLPRLLPVTP
ncbi:extensin [Streptomyces tropicalis]|uniref:Extensin n=1 Tax=Streptomyces tropicalis TaxID=3034234 RepID=A0ABT6A1L2_9ACTN|nr:extensin [Streptomyces tropicalis]MDF3298266.1 extensin [Streptomyces tropicalis]